MISTLERKYQPLASRRVFLGRVVRHFLLTVAIVGGSLLLGTVGYCVFGDMNWIDGLLNASMILTGMGPVTQMQTTAGKLFSVFYALFSGIVFLTLVAILITPIYHRLLHHFHMEESDTES